MDEREVEFEFALVCGFFFLASTDDDVASSEIERRIRRKVCLKGVLGLVQESKYRKA
jgi:hypothetical protein